MRESRTYLIEGVVTRRRDFLEKDRILTVFTKERGKMDILAKGARRPGSKLSYTSDLATVAVFKMNSLKSIDMVMETKSMYLPEGAFGDVSKSNKIFLALGIINSLYREGEKHTETYEALKRLIYFASQKDSKFGFVSFLRNVIVDHGIVPRLDVCSCCENKIKPTEKAVFSVKDGLAHDICVQGIGEELAKSDWDFLRLIFSNDFSEENLLLKKFENDTYQNVLSILHKYFLYHFQDNFPRPIENF